MGAITSPLRYKWRRLVSTCHSIQRTTHGSPPIVQGSSNLLALKSTGPRPVSVASFCKQSRKAIERLSRKPCRTFRPYTDVPFPAVGRDDHFECDSNKTIES